MVAACYTSQVRLVLVDSNPDVALALAEAFKTTPEVEVIAGELLQHAEGTIVSPANSQGFMDGGIDAAFATFFGPSLERAVRDAIAARPEGYLPVGASVIVATGHERIRYVIVAPTMMSPEWVEPQNAYRAMRAVLRVVVQLPVPDRQIWSPGLGTGVGGVEPADAAREMAAAYGDWLDSLR